MSQPTPTRAQAKVAPGHPFFELIQDAYRVFSTPKPLSTDVCIRCCMDPRIEAHFFDPPIAEMPLEYVRDWFSAAPLVGGIGQCVWSFLLPRVLEILAVGEEPSFVGLEVSLKRFPTGKADKWSDAQWTVLDRFQRAYLEQAVNGIGEHLDDVICMFSLAGWPLDALIGQVEAQDDAALADRLWHDWCEWIPGFVGEIWLTTFWEAEERRTVLEFYTSEALYARMEALALSDAVDLSLAAKASAIASVIESSAAKYGL